MGCCVSRTPLTGTPSSDSEDFNSKGKNGAPEIERVKLILLGAGESGKSTLFKQMTVNYNREYSKDSLKVQSFPIVQSIYTAFGFFLEAVLKKDPKLGGDESLLQLAEEIYPKGGRPPNILSKKDKDFMIAIWFSETGKEIWETREKHSITDSLRYFMNDIDRISSKDYIATEEDMLNARIRTPGVLQQSFMFKGVSFLVIDVGGQRNERTKWVQCIDDVTAVIFVASLSAFDQTLFEDKLEMRLPEALSVFEKTFTFLPFRKTNTPFVLFLNKEDLLKEKLAKLEAKGANLDDFFPDLQLGTNYENCVEKVKEHIKNLFLSMCNEQQLNRVIPHYITATDKTIFLKIFKSAVQVILRKALDEHFKGSFGV